MRSGVAFLCDPGDEDALMEEHNTASEIMEGRVLGATVAALAEDRVLVELEGSARGWLPLADVRDRETGAPRVKPGDRIEVFVEQRSGAEWQVSRDKAERLALVDRLEARFRAGETVEGMVVGEVEGGFAVDLGIKAFLPASQFAARPVRDPDQVLGQTFSLKIIRFDRERANVVVSRRAVIEAERERSLGALKPDAIVEGTVKSIVDYGAFVDVGGIDGLLHISDMSWGRVKHPSDLVQVGQRLTVKVLKLDQKAGKVSLGLRQLEDDPWLEVPSKYPVGTQVTGLVVSKTDYGCFLALEPGVDGLVHSTGPTVTDGARAALKKVDIGDDLSARVVDLDLSQKRLSLVLVEP
jgi:small subunit ribosomal protein S1